MGLVKKHVAIAYCAALLLFTLLLAPLDLYISRAGIDLFSIYFMQFAPGLAAVVISLSAVGRAGFIAFWQKSFQWKIRSSLYLLSLLVAVWMALSNVVLVGISLNSIAVSALSGIIIGCAAEEIGWRGFLLPEFLKCHGVLKSSLFVGILWELWHSPLRFVMLYNEDVAGFLLSYALMAASTIGLSIILTIIYLRAGGSVIPSILFHSVHNILLVYLSPLQTGLLQTVTFFAGTVIVTLVMVRFFGLAVQPESRQVVA